MSVTLDTTWLQINNLQPNEYVLLSILYGETKNNANIYIKKSKIGNKLVAELVAKCLLVDTRNSDLEELSADILSLTEKAKKLFDSSDWFDEVLKAYPTYAIRTDGTKDYLKIDTNRCRKFYNKYVGKDRSKHDQILEALKTEITIREAENSTNFFFRLPKWLSSEYWMAYKDRTAEAAAIEINKKKQTGGMYGTDIE